MISLFLATKKWSCPINRKYVQNAHFTWMFYIIHFLFLRSHCHCTWYKQNFSTKLCFVPLAINYTKRTYYLHCRVFHLHSKCRYLLYITSLFPLFSMTSKGYCTSIFLCGGTLTMNCPCRCAVAQRNVKPALQLSLEHKCHE